MFLHFTAMIEKQSNKKAIDGEDIDMVDSSNSGAGCCIHRPEEETVMLLENDKQRLPNSNKYNDKQINDDASVTFDKHRNNCDNIHGSNERNGDESSGVNNSGDTKNIAQTPNKTADDLFVDEEDPYAELQSYLDKVKVSFIS